MGMWRVHVPKCSVSVWGRVNENGSLKSIWQDKWGPNFLRKQAIQKRRRNTFKNHSDRDTRKVKIMRLFLLTFTFLALTQGFLLPREVKETFLEKNPPKERENEALRPRLTILRKFWQFRLLLNSIWSNRNNVKKDPVEIRGEQLLREIGENYDTGMFTPRAWLKMLQGHL